MGQKAKGAKAKVTEAVYVRLTPDEYTAICKAAEDCGLSASRYLARAAYDRAIRVPTKVETSIPPRFTRRAQTLRRLRGKYEPGRPEYEALDWAVSIHRWMTTDATGRRMPGMPPQGIEVHLAAVAAAHRERRRGPVLGAIQWSLRMASWVRSLSSSPPGPSSPSQRGPTSGRDRGTDR